jgi:hypothetical protein
MFDRRRAPAIGHAIGVLIATPRGQKNVEKLETGDGEDGFQDFIGRRDQEFDSFDSFDSVDNKLGLICGYESICTLEAASTSD